MHTFSEEFYFVASQLGEGNYAYETLFQVRGV